MVQKTYRDGLNGFNITVYGFGHVFNDLAGAQWFNYAIYFFTKILHINASYAGAIMLAGQIADGLSTPLVGLGSDACNTGIGRRKPWYIAGTFILGASFAWLWMPCAICGDNDTFLEFCWYAFFGITFNIGWACMQIAHMSLIPQLSIHKNRKNILIGLRTAWTYISNFLVLAVAFLLFTLVESPKDQFLILSMFVLGLGVLLNIFFIFGVNEVKLSQITDEENAKSRKPKRKESYHDALLIASPRRVLTPISQRRRARESNEQPLLPEAGIGEDVKITAGQWLRTRAYWPVAFSYMFARMAINTNMSLLPFYLTIVVHAGGITDPEELETNTPWELAIIPLISYLGSIGTSLLLEKLGNSFTRNQQFMAGMLGVVIGTLPMFFLTEDLFAVMYPIAVILGVGFSLQLNNAMGFIADFIGPYGSSGAFVYGSISLFDKFASGIALFVIMSAADINDVTYCTCVVPGISLVGAVVAWLITLCMKSTAGLRKDSLVSLDSVKIN